MADITRIGKLVQGVQRNIDISNNTLVTQSIKVGGPTTNTELTKAILDNLVNLQNGSDAGSLHNHDGRYFTETELGSTGTTSGAMLIGIKDASSQFTSTTVEGALDEALDAAQAAAADVVTLSNNLASTAHSKGASLIGIEDTATQFTATNVEDALAEALDAAQAAAADVVTLSNNLASVAHNKGASLIGIEDTASQFTSTTVEGALAEALDAAQAAQADASAVIDDVSHLVTLTGVAVDSTNLGTFSGTTIADNRTIKAALQDLETAVENSTSIVNNFEWQESVKDRLTTPPVSKATGDRYLVISPATDDWLGKEDKIAEWNGTAWIFTDPTVGTFVASDAEPNGLYLYSGTAWDKKYFEATTASTGLTKSGFDVRLANANQNGLNVTSGTFTVNVDGTSIERGSGSGNPLQIKFGTSGSVAVSATDLASTANGKGAALIGIEDTAAQFTSTNVEGALTEALDAAQAAAADVTTLTNNLASTANGKGASLIGIEDVAAQFTATTVEGALAEALDAAQAAQADVDDLVTLSGVAVNSTHLGTFTGTTIPDSSDIKEALQALETAVEGAQASSNSVILSFIAGEALTAGDIVIMSQSTAGQVLKADSDAIATCEGVIGVALETVSGSASVKVQVAGKVAVNGTFVSGDKGKRIYVSGTAGSGTATAPSDVDTVVYLIGILVDNSTKEIVLQQQLVGIN